MPNTGDKLVIDRDGLRQLLAALALDGYRVVGPTVRDRAIVYDELASPDDLPEGWTDRQDGGEYALERRSDRVLFGYAVGPHSWKQYLHPPIARLWQAEGSSKGFEVDADVDAPRFAFIGVRSCELHAIRIHDKVFLEGPAVDPHYRVRRDAAFIVAVNCGEPGGTCFCVSMGTGPRVDGGYDLALTELLDGRHDFLVEVGTAAGAAMMADVAARPADADDLAAADAVVVRAAQRMGRGMDTNDIKGLLQRNPEHPRWDDVAARCLTCGNCTMVCPTCFCTTVEDVTDLSGTKAERIRRWDSCFTMDFSYIHGGSVRHTGRSRYRQWMTHKLAHWIDQFGTSGCVGCGRCITWCPVGIDITEETRAIRETDGKQKKGGGADERT
jgi:sulfhydrogenase subunit beta (sulfur reductase)